MQVVTPKMVTQLDYLVQNNHLHICPVSSLHLPNQKLKTQCSENHEEKELTAYNHQSDQSKVLLTRFLLLFPYALQSCINISG